MNHTNLKIAINWQKVVIHVRLEATLFDTTGLNDFSKMSQKADLKMFAFSLILTSTKSEKLFLIGKCGDNTITAACFFLKKLQAKG